MQAILLTIGKRVLLSRMFRNIACKIIVKLLKSLAARSDTKVDDNIVDNIEMDLKTVGYIK